MPAAAGAFAADPVHSAAVAVSPEPAADQGLTLQVIASAPMPAMPDASLQRAEVAPALAVTMPGMPRDRLAMMPARAAPDTGGG